MPVQLTVEQNPYFLFAHDVDNFGFARIEAEFLLLAGLFFAVSNICCFALIKNIYYVNRLAEHLTSVILALGLGRNFLEPRLFWFSAVVILYLVTLFVIKDQLNRVTWVGGGLLLIVGIILGPVRFVLAGAELELSLSARTVQETAVLGNEVPHIFLFILDEVSYPAIYSQQGAIHKTYPSLERFASAATEYTQAFAPAGYTHLSVPAILSGLDRELELRQKAPSVLRILSPIHQVEKIGDRVPRHIKKRFKADVELSRQILRSDTVVLMINLFVPHDVIKRLEIPEIEGRWIGYGNNSARLFKPDIFDVTRYLSESEHSKPLFAMWHTELTHHPWSQDMDGNYLSSKLLPMTNDIYVIGLSNHCLSTADGVIGCRSFSTQELLEMAKRMYTGNIGFVDKELEIAFSAIRSAGVWDNSLIVVTADHGFGFEVGIGGRDAEQGDALWNQLAHVPLIVKYPEQRTHERVSTRVSISQLAATLLSESKRSLASLDPTSLPPLPKVDGAARPVENLFFTSGDLRKGSVKELLIPPRRPESTFLENRSHIADALHPDSPYSVGSAEVFVNSGVSLADDFHLVDGEVANLSPKRNTYNRSKYAAIMFKVSADDCPGSQGLVTADGKVLGTIQFQARSPGNVKTGWSIYPRQANTNLEFYCQQ